MHTDAKPVLSKSGRRRNVLSWGWIALWLVLSIVFIGARWVRALDLLLLVFVFFSTMGLLRDKSNGRDVAATEEGKGPPSVRGPWVSLINPGGVMLSSFLHNNTNLYILDWHELVLPMVLVFAMCMLAWLPFALRNPKRKQALLAAAICAVCFALLGTAGLNHDLDDGTPICTEARYLRDGQRQYFDELELPDGSVVGVDNLYWEPKITPIQPNAMVDFTGYQGPLGIRYAAFHIDSSWKGNPFAIAYHRVRDWLLHRG
jgi:hypothetical protein